MRLELVEDRELAAQADPHRGPERRRGRLLRRRERLRLPLEVLLPGLALRVRRAEAQLRPGAAERRVRREGVPFFSFF